LTENFANAMEALVSSPVTVTHIPNTTFILFRGADSDSFCEVTVNVLFPGRLLARWRRRRVMNDFRATMHRYGYNPQFRLLRRMGGKPILVLRMTFRVLNFLVGPIPLHARSRIRNPNPNQLEVYPAADINYYALTGRQVSLAPSK
jgi:hypothetical protein